MFGVSLSSIHQSRSGSQEALATSSSSPGGHTKVFPGQWGDIISWLYPMPAQGLLQVGHAQNISPGRCPGGVLARCPNHITWLLSMQRSSDSTPSYSRMSELLALSLKLSLSGSFDFPVSSAVVWVVLAWPPSLLLPYTLRDLLQIQQLAVKSV